jgi:oligoribonuclease (3'-5' exoribonuclease)
MSKRVFVDIETTGLDPFVHSVIEIASYIEEDVYDGTDDMQWHCSLPFDPYCPTVSKQALETNKYFERVEELEEIQESSYEVAEIIRDQFKGAVLIGNNPQFDARFLEQLLATKLGIGPVWHYHVVDIKALVAGHYGVAPPWSTKQIEELTGIKNDGAHTALEDMRWVRKVYRNLNLQRRS